MSTVDYQFGEVMSLLMAPPSSPFHHPITPGPHRPAEDWPPQRATSSPQLPDMFIEPPPHGPQMPLESFLSPPPSPSMLLSSASPHISSRHLEPPAVSRLRKERPFFSESPLLESPSVHPTPLVPTPASPKPVPVSSHPRRNPARDLVTPVQGIKVSSNAPTVEWRNGTKTILPFLPGDTSGLNLLYRVRWFPTRVMMPC